MQAIEEVSRLCWWHFLNTNATEAVGIRALFDLLLTNREELGVNVTTGSSRNHQ